MAPEDVTGHSSHAELRLIEAAYRDAFTSSSGGGSTGVSPQPARVSLPGYTIVREIRRGAQGVVYEAVQERTRRRVALKLVHGGAIAGGRARFEREVQILARLRHPHIVTIHDSNVTADHAYFVMDYIDGCALDAYVCDEHCDVQRVCQLFAQISDAVHAAHLQGVIHRDLKPSNVRIDQEGEPRVLDFGLAKLIAPEGLGEDDHIVLTHTGQFVGSIPWASPEQAEGGEDELDVRSDVYSLGVMLYQSLTGQFPYTVTGNMRRVLDNICTVEPSPPSALNPSVNDEVDTIVRKCLSKERTRRYQFAGELARDLERYLAGEPIEAKRDSSWYFLRKTIQRHRMPVAAIGVLALLLVGFTITVSILLRQTQHQRDEALAARTAEAAARRSAEAEATKALRVQEFLSGVLRSANPFRDGGDMTVREALDTAAARLDDDPVGDPQVEAGIRTALGASYVGVGAFADGEDQLRRALALLDQRVAPDHPDRLDVQHQLVRALHHRGDLDAAVRLAEETLEARQRAQGPDHDATLTSALDLAALWRAQGELLKAEQALDDLVTRRREGFGDDHLRTLEAVAVLAWTYKDLGRLAEAEELFHEVYEAYVAIHGREHPNALTALNNLATVRQDLGRLADAEASYREVLALQQVALGEYHPYTLSTMSNLGNILRERGKLDEAEALLGEAVEARRRVLGVSHESTLSSMNNLGLLLMSREKLTDAEVVLRDAVDVSTLELGEDHAMTLTTVSNLASLFTRQNNWHAAAPLFLHVLEVRRRQLGDEHPRTLLAMNNYAAVTLKDGDVEEAVNWSRLAWTTAREKLGADHLSTLAFQINYARCQAAGGEFEQAETLLTQARAALAASVGPDHAYTRRAAASLEELYEACGKPESIDVPGRQGEAPPAGS